MYPFLSRRVFLGRISRLSLTSLAASALVAEAQNSNGQTQDAESKKSSPKEDPVYEPGKDVKAPKLIHYVEPQFSPSSKEAFVEGTVKISVIVTTDGIPTNLKIVNGLNTQEDQTAIEALKQWRFQPGTKAGQPVKVKVTVEVDFHLL